MDDQPVITFVGAGSVVFTRDLLFDILAMPELQGATLRLHDIDAERLDTAERMAHRVAAQLGAKPTVTTHLELAPALDGADFVINAVNVGGHAATLVDFDVPERFGLRQTIGDTLGVGGIFRALRTFPVLDRIAETIVEVCPDAWLLSYTNPMSMNLTYLAARHPRVKALGLCHSVYWTVHGLCELIGVPLEGTRYLAAGVNHQAWLLRWEHAGEDLYPRLDARHRRRPRAAPAGAGGHVPQARPLPDRDQRALQRVPAVVPPPRQRDRPVADPGRRLQGHQCGQPRGVRGDPAAARRRPAAGGGRRHRVRAAGDPLAW